MKAKDWIKAGFCLYIGWEISRVLDLILGVHGMDWLKKHAPEFADIVEAEYRRKKKKKNREVIV